VRKECELVLDCTEMIMIDSGAHWLRHILKHRTEKQTTLKQIQMT